MTEHHLAISMGLDGHDQALAESLVAGFIASCSDIEDEDQEAARYLARGALLATACFTRPYATRRIISAEEGNPIEAVVSLGVEQMTDIVSAAEVGDRVRSLIRDWEGEEVDEIMQDLPEVEEGTRTSVMRGIEAAVLRRMNLE